MNKGDLVTTHAHDLVGVVNEIRKNRVTLAVLWNKPPRMQGCRTCVIGVSELEPLPTGTRVTKVYKIGDPVTIEYGCYDSQTGKFFDLNNHMSFTAVNLDGTVSLEFEFVDDVSTKNNKQYTQLGIEPWDIMQADFTREEFIGFLKGNIIKYCLRKKGSDLQDFEKIEHYARKLQEVLKDEN